jgi:endonuclease/exonuclease/phosphatase family metal-dependent hydrolase
MPQLLESPLDQIITGGFVPPRIEIWPRDSFRVVDWNIDRGLKLPGVIAFLKSCKADIILLQEVDQNARRTHHLDVGSEIALALQMNYVFAREFQELTQGSRSSPAYHGQATFSRWPLSNPRIIRFQKQSNFWNPHWFLPPIEPFQERLGGRMALVAEACVAGKPIVTYNLHLESKGDDQLRCTQLSETLDDARRYDAKMPIALAGDFNLDLSEGVGARAMSQAQFQDAFANHHVPTTPHSFLEKGRIIDWIFTRGPVRSSEAKVHRSVTASDHYPFSMTLEFAER